MLQSLLAVIAGFAAMAVIVMIATALAALLLVPGGMRAMAAPGAALPRRYLTANLSGSTLAAFAGGMITARIAPTAPIGHGVALGALMVVMSLVSMRQAGGTQPRWYQLTLMVGMPLVAIAGAWWTVLPR